MSNLRDDVDKEHINCEPSKRIPKRKTGTGKRQVHTVDGKGGAGANERSRQTRPPTMEPAKERSWNQIEDGGLESGRARLVKQNHRRKQGNSGAEEHGLALPGDELCQVHNSVRFIREWHCWFGCRVRPAGAFNIST